MGKRGPAPLPAELHERRGTLRRDRHGDGMPFMLAGKPLEAPAAPAHLSDAERQTWDELAPIFHEAGILDRGDLLALEAMIVAVARARRADRELRELERKDGSVFGGLVSRGDRGYVIHPLVKVSRDAWAEARSWFAKFGATPSDRVGLAVGGLQGISLAEELRRALEGDGTPTPADQLAIEGELVDGCDECGSIRGRRHELTCSRSRAKAAA